LKRQHAGPHEFQQDRAWHQTVSCPRRIYLPGSSRPGGAAHLIGKMGHLFAMLEYHQQWAMLQELMGKSNLGILKKS